MTIQNYSDNGRYLSCRKGINFYYFGEGCIADYYGNSVAFLDSIDMEIVERCKNGMKEFELNRQHESFSLRWEGVSERIKRLKKVGVLVERADPSDMSPSFFGEKGYYFPKYLTIEITNTCNFWCPFCYKNATGDGTFISDRKIDEINSLIYGKVHRITLSGGEPTIHPNYLKYIDIFSEYAEVSMITNGSLLFEHDSSVLKKLKEIQFSIYGCNDKEYEKTTGCNDGFTRLCRSVETARRNNLQIAFALPVCELTANHLEEFVITSIQMGIKTLRMTVADSFGRGKYLDEKSLGFDKMENEIYKRMDILKRKYRKDIFLDFARINTKHICTHQDIVENVYRGSFNCGNGSESLVISQAGKIRPCEYLPESIFSVDSPNALEEHINGNFHIDLLGKSIKNYLKESSCMKSCQPCGAMEDFILRGKR